MLSDMDPSNIQGNTDTATAMNAKSNVKEQSSVTGDQGQAASKLAAQTPATQRMKRAPSLQELVQSMRNSNPDKWEKLKAQDSLNGVAGGNPPESGPNAVSVPGSNADSTADGPRLRLTARLGASNSGTNSVTPVSRSNSISNETSTTASNAMVRNGSVSSSHPSSRLPTLEAIQSRFASKEAKDKSQGSTTPKASPTTLDFPVQANPSSTLQPSSIPMSRSQTGATSTSSCKSGYTSQAHSDNASTASLSPATSMSSIESVADLEEKDTELAGLKGDDAKSTPPRPTISITNSEETRTAGPDGSLAAPTAAEHPLEHTWTLHYDSRSTAAAASRKAKESASNGSTSGSSAQSTTWEASLSTIGSFSCVEDFSRLFNCMKKPSKMGSNENLHLFKDGIRPMWEDERNLRGGKWVFTIPTFISGVNGKATKERVDTWWLWLCMALVGQDLTDYNDAVCGCVLSTRPRFYRLQVWVNDREDILAVNGVGKRLVELLELDEFDAQDVPTTPTLANSSPLGTGKLQISFEFQYHKGQPQGNRYISVGLPSSAITAAASSSQFTSPSSSGSRLTTSVSSHNFRSSPMGSFGQAGPSKPAPAPAPSMSRSNSMTGSLSTTASPGGLPPGLAAPSSGVLASFGMSRSASTGNIHTAAPVAEKISWRERLGQTGGTRRSLLQPKDALQATS